MGIHVNGFQRLTCWGYITKHTIGLDTAIDKPSRKKFKGLLLVRLTT